MRLFSSTLLKALICGCMLALSQPSLAQTAATRPAAPGPAQDAATRKALENTVMIMASGRLTGYTQFAEDISIVLDAVPGNEMRVIPVIGKSAGQNVLDMLNMRGVDMGVVDQDILSYLKRTNPRAYGDIEKRIQFITKLFNAEFHIYAKTDIRSLEDLAGKKVSCLKPMSTVALLCENVFFILGIKPEIVYDDTALAMQKVKNGEVAAAARASQPPLQGFEQVKPEDNLHFVPISQATLPNSNFNGLRATYLPARLKSVHYPTMIAAGEDVPTIATSSLLAVRAWPVGTAGHGRVANFTAVFFNNIELFAKSPRHPGWADVNLAAEVPGWTRYVTAQQWLDKKRKSAPAVTGSVDASDQMKTEFLAFVEEFTKNRGSGAPLTEPEKAGMWKQFQQWSVQQQARR